MNLDRDPCRDCVVWLCGWELGVIHATYARQLFFSNTFFWERNPILDFFFLSHTYSNKNKIVEF